MAAMTDELKFGFALEMGRQDASAPRGGMVAVLCCVTVGRVGLEGFFFLIFCGVSPGLLAVLWLFQWLGGLEAPPTIHGLEAPRPGSTGLWKGWLWKGWLWQGWALEGLSAPGRFDGRSRGRRLGAGGSESSWLHLRTAVPSAVGKFGFALERWPARCQRSQGELPSLEHSSFGGESWGRLLAGLFGFEEGLEGIAAVAGGGDVEGHGSEVFDEESGVDLVVV